MRRTFLGLPEAPERARVALIPAPYDATTSFRPGTRFGPRALLEVSPYMEFFDEETGEKPQETLGFYTLEEPELPAEPEKALEVLSGRVEEVLSAGKLPVLLGGEHTVSLAALRVLRRAHGPFRLLYLDAHLDLRESYQETPWSHACVLRRAVELGLEPLVVGARSLSEEEFHFLKKAEIPVLWAREFRETPERVRQRLEEFLRGPLYVSLDLDVFDPAEAPGVGTPEPGGLSWYEVLGILRQAARAPVLGFDLVELLPLPGDPRTEYLAARLLFKFLAYLSAARP
ncbi:agmatinase [Thermosulfurimonas marina]|uniref:Agmatinase n=1 Tax=Thermosulfurimonas marina TaxID=2047767 RepID=A0A6H1WR52_9BACT|nr:agmatinase [Thermosulfurimonas marina]QJA05648.1 agmatinase [Thermosulfurimonas marina]